MEVGQPSQELITRLRDNKVIGLGRHSLSEYVIRPVACDKLPFSITHVNPYNKAKQNKFSNYRGGPPRQFYRGGQAEDRDRNETEEAGVIKIPKNLSMEEQIEYLKR